MARTEARILSAVWRDFDFVSRSVGAQWLYFALLSQPELSMCGVLPTALERWSGLSTNSKPRTLAAWLAELHEWRFIVHDKFTREVWIRTYMRHDGVFNSPNLIVAMARDYGAVHSEDIRGRIADEVREGFPKGLAEGLGERFPKGFPDGLAKRFPKEFLEGVSRAYARAHDAPVTLSPSHPNHLFPANAENPEPESPVRKEAHVLTRLAFEQPIKPELRSNGNAFPAALNLIERVLKAGHPAASVEAAILAGVDVWTLAGLQTAVAKARPRPVNGNGHADLVDDGCGNLVRRVKQ